MFRTRKQSLLGELIELRATGEAGSPSALNSSPASGTGACGAGAAAGGASRHRVTLVVGD